MTHRLASTIQRKSFTPSHYYTSVSSLKTVDNVMKSSMAMAPTVVPYHKSTVQRRATPSHGISLRITVTIIAGVSILALLIISYYCSRKRKRKKFLVSKVLTVNNCDHSRVSCSREESAKGKSTEEEGSTCTAMQLLGTNVADLESQIASSNGAKELMKGFSATIPPLPSSSSTQSIPKEPSVSTSSFFKSAQEYFSQSQEMEVKPYITVNSVEAKGDRPSSHVSSHASYQSILSRIIESLDKHPSLYSHQHESRGENKEITSATSCFSSSRSHQSGVSRMLDNAFSPHGSKSGVKEFESLSNPVSSYATAVQDPSPSKDYPQESLQDIENPVKHSPVTLVASLSKHDSSATASSKKSVASRMTEAVPSKDSLQGFMQVIEIPVTHSSVNLVVGSSEHYSSVAPSDKKSVASKVVETIDTFLSGFRSHLTSSSAVEIIQKPESSHFSSAPHQIIFHDTDSQKFPELAPKLWTGVESNPFSHNTDESRNQIIDSQDFPEVSPKPLTSVGSNSCSLYSCRDESRDIAAGSSRHDSSVASSNKKSASSKVVETIDTFLSGFGSHVTRSGVETIEKPESSQSSSASHQIFFHRTDSQKKLELAPKRFTCIGSNSFSSCSNTDESRDQMFGHSTDSEEFREVSPKPLTSVGSNSFSSYSNTDESQQKVAGSSRHDSSAASSNKKSVVAEAIDTFLSGFGSHVTRSGVEIIEKPESSQSSSASHQICFHGTDSQKKLELAPKSVTSVGSNSFSSCSNTDESRDTIVGHSTDSEEFPEVSPKSLTSAGSNSYSSYSSTDESQNNSPRSGAEITGSRSRISETLLENPVTPSFILARLSRDDSSDAAFCKTNATSKDYPQCSPKDIGNPVTHSVSRHDTSAASSNQKSDASKVTGIVSTFLSGLEPHETSSGVEIIEKSEGFFSSSVSLQSIGHSSYSHKFQDAARKSFGCSTLSNSSSPYSDTEKSEDSIFGGSEITESWTRSSGSSSSLSYLSNEQRQLAQDFSVNSSDVDRTSLCYFLSDALSY
jgi:hypothetical protein